jgi:hypothetical protein
MEIAKVWVQLACSRSAENIEKSGSEMEDELTCSRMLTGQSI